MKIKIMEGGSPQQHCNNSDVHFSRGQGRGHSVSELSSRKQVKINHLLVFCCVIFWI
jgi:hypothetical protein